MSLLGLAALSLSGCALTSTQAPATIDLSAMHGKIMGGEQPILNATVTLYAAGTGGYGSTPTQLAQTTTSSGGGFNFNNAQGAKNYTCPASINGFEPQLYVTATGGNPGLPSGNNNAVFLALAFGNCSGANGSVTITINEVTTVATAYALSGFIDPATGNIGAPSTNLQGLSDGFLNANTLASVLGVVQASTTNVAVPGLTVNSLADILQTCVNSNGATGQTPASACDLLFTNATPPAGTGAAAPTNTFQAALNIARYPGNNVTSLFNLAPGATAFVPNLGSAPNDWTLGVAYTNPALLAPSALAIDGKDQVYVYANGAVNGTVQVYSPQGALLNSALSTLAVSHNVRSLAIDAGSTNLFFTDGSASNIYQVPINSGSNTPTALSYATATPTADTNKNNYIVAVDQFGDAWTTSYKRTTCSTGGSLCELIEFAKGASTPYTAYSGFSTGSSTVSVPSAGIGGARGVAYDVNNGNVFITDAAEGSVQRFITTASATGVATASASATNYVLPGTQTSNDATYGYGAYAVAVGKSDTAWVVVQGGPAQPTSTNTPATASTTAINAGLYSLTTSGMVTQINTGSQLLTPNNDVVDGNNNIFIANTGANYTTAPNSSITGTTTYTPTVSSIVEYNTTTNSVASPNIGFSPNGTYTSSTGTLTGSLYAAAYLAVDKSGSLWVLSPGSTSSPVVAPALVQIFGVAAPTQPVLASGSYGVKP